MSLRVMPDMAVIRPADARETEVLFRKAVDMAGPSCFCLTRQKVAFLPATREEVEAAARGAWTLVKVAKPALVIFATGSEVELALQALELLRAEGGIYLHVNVVSVPCWELFFAEPREYQEEVLVWACKRRVSIEAGATLGWERFVGHDGLTIGLDHYGASGPASALAKAFGFTPAQVAERIKKHFL